MTSTVLELIGILVFFMIYRMPRLLRYNFDWRSSGNITSSELMTSIFLMYFLIILRLDKEATLLVVIMRLC